jgi:DNA-binding response OmpR family regulator
MLQPRTPTPRLASARRPAASRAGPAATVGEPVLLVSAEPWLLELLSLQLRAAACFPLAAASIDEGRRLLAQVVPALLVLDLDGLPAAGLAWAAQQAQPEAGRALPLVLLGQAQKLQAAATRAHLAAASLCQPKPFEPRELVQQLLGLLRPAAAHERLAPLQCGAVELAQDQPTLRLRRGKAWVEVDLPRTEHRLLSCLLAEPSRVHSREDICRAVWAEHPVDLRTVDQYVRRLRRSLATAGLADLVKTVNGSGYRINATAPSL